jgi:hypothetical protein
MRSGYIGGSFSKKLINYPMIQMLGGLDCLLREMQYQPYHMQ